jgi:hypothetical protein
VVAAAVQVAVLAGLVAVVPRVEVRHRLSGILRWLVAMAAGRHPVIGTFVGHNQFAAGGEASQSRMVPRTEAALTVTVRAASSL